MYAAAGTQERRSDASCQRRVDQPAQKPPLKREGLALGLWGEPGIGKSYTLNEPLQQTPCRSRTLHATAPLSEVIRALPSAAKLPA